MGIAIPQLAPASEDRASGAQVIDGSLKFDSSKNQYLQFTPGSSGNRKTWTFSCWIKRNGQGDGSTSTTAEVIFSSGAVSVPWGIIQLNNNNTIQNSVFAGSSAGLYTNAVFRDTGSFFHLCSVFDTTATGNDKWRTYINGVEQTYSNSNYPSDNTDYQFNQANANHRIGYGEWYADFQMSQCYFIDGQALSPTDFGYTDPLTNTWRPKKYTGTFERFQETSFNAPLNSTPFTASKGSLTNNTSVGTKSALTNSLGVSTVADFGGNDRITTNYSLPSNNFTCDVYFEHNNSTAESYVLGVGSGAFIQVDPAFNTTNITVYGAYQVDLGSYGFKHVRIQCENSITTVWSNGTQIDQRAATPGSTGTVYIGAHATVTTRFFTGGIGPVRFINAALGAPPSGGLSVNGDGTLDDVSAQISSNSFYLPMDGNSPIGEDKSGNGNHWTPVNFGGSNTIEKATGALPILNTDGGGKTARPGTRPDANASNLVLALPLVGSTADVSNQINSGSTTKVVTENGTITNTYTTGNFYGASTTLGGANGDNLTIPDSEDFNLGSGEWTFEAWIRTTTSAGRTASVVFNQSTANATSNSSIFFGAGNNGISLYVSTSGTSWTDNINSDATINDGEWHHIVWQRRGNTLEIYKDGILQPVVSGNSSFTGTINNSSRLLYIGQQDDSANNYSGQLQDLRIYKGVAKYTSNFIPASTNPDILPDTPSGVSGSSKLTKITDGAVTLSANTDYLDISSSSDFAYGTGDFTIEAYIYTRSSPSANIGIVDHRTEGVAAANDKLQFALITDNTLQIYIDSATLISTTNICAPRAWHHVAYCRSGGTGRIFIDGILSGSASDSYNYGNARCAIGHHPTVSSRDFPGSISNLRIVNGTALYTSNFTPPTRALTAVANTKLLCCQSNTSATAAAVQPTATNTRIPSGFSWWDAGATAGWNEAASNTSTIYSDYVAVALPTSGKIYWETVVKNPATYRVIGVTDDGGAARGNNGYQDNVSGFYYNGNPPIYLAKRSGGTSTASSVTHGASSGTNWVSGDIIMWAVDCDNARMWIGLNGTWYASGNPAAGTNYAFHNMETPSGGNYFKLAYATNSGGPATFEIKTEANSTLLADKGNASATTFNPFTTDINAVRGQESGYCTWNPLTKTGGTLSNGNLQLGGTSAWQAVKGEFSVSSGKWYYEATVVGNTYGTAQGNVAFGIGWYKSKENTQSVDVNNSSHYVNLVAFSQNGWWNNFGAMQSSVTSTTAGDVIGLALDKDSNNFEFYKNGISILSGNLANTTDDLSPWCNAYYSNSFFDCNFGQKPFKFPPPDGFQPLNAANVRPSTVIVRPDKYFGVVTFTGSASGGTYTLPISNPDLVWSKNRALGSTNHTIQDSVRGFGDGQNIYSNLTNGPSGTANITAIDGTTATYGTNNNFTGNCVTWCWKAGGGSSSGGEYWIDDVQYADAAAAGLDGGSGITLTGASVGTKQGFSILRYTGGASGSTLSHGLTQAPDFWIIKNLSGSTQGTAGPHWYTKHHAGLTGGKTGNYSYFLNLTNGEENGPHGICRTSGDSLFEFVDGSANDVNWHTHDSAATYICYAWHDVPGLQKFGTYQGSGTDASNGPGPFVELGFRPALVIVHDTAYASANSDWCMFDSARPGYNKSPAQNRLEANTQNAEDGDARVGNGNGIDILSNGFRIRSANWYETNTLGKFIYAAWAEAPSFNLYGAQSNAR